MQKKPVITNEELNQSLDNKLDKINLIFNELPSSINYLLEMTQDENAEVRYRAFEALSCCQKFTAVKHKYVKG